MRTIGQIRTMLDQARPHMVRLRRAFNQAIGNSVFSVDICADGPRFFAHLNWCLEILRYCAANRLTPLFNVSTPYLLQHPRDNWFDYYFFHKHNARKPLPFTTYPIRSVNDIGFIWHGLPELSLHEGHQLFNNYVGVREEILAKCALFYNQQMACRPVLGVHFRGSDKTCPGSEAPAVSYDRMTDIIQKHLATHPDLKQVFVATDEVSFISHLRCQLGQDRVIFRPNEHYASGNLPAYDLVKRSGDEEAYLKGEEALIDCLLLSKCQALIKTASILSGWSAVFNPELPVIMVTRPVDECLWFPERAILKSQYNAEQSR